MKKIFLSILLAGSLFTSCDMDLNEPGKITDNESIQTVDDCLAYRNGLYSSFRALTSGSYIYDTELEMDQFLGMFANGNRGLAMSNASINSSTSDIGDIFSGSYSTMKNVNFLIEHGNTIYNSLDPESDDAIDLARYLAEAHFFRAYFYYYLYDHFCPAYDPAKGDQEGLGLQLVTRYEPTGDTSKYPGRSSQNVTLKLINEDLTTAFNGLVEYEKYDDDNCVSNANYISSYAVAALQARVALVSSQYQTAVDKANYVIESGKFPLTTGEDYFDMWATDFGSELILVPFVNADESAYVGSILDGWAYTYLYPSRVDYAPTNTVIEYYTDEDIRKDSFLEWVDGMSFGDMGETSLYTFVKFPGNRALISGSNLYKNMPKPFRTSELYLIVAEASDALSKPVDANAALKAIREARIDGYTHTDLSGSALSNAIRAERSKELIGEGFRMSDLRRWGVGFSRDSSYPINPEVEDFFIESTKSVVFTANDYRYVWPIPYDEMQVNPQLKGQQNPGYEI